MSNPLTSSDTLTSLAKNQGIKTLEELINHIQNLPYGRNGNREDMSLVLKEGKGTCSSKHALLKQIADLNEVPDVKLFIGIYKMNHMNTPKIGIVLLQNNLEYIPDSHCYLRINGKPVDITSPNSDFQKIANDILKEIEIQPEQVNEFKVRYHQDLLREWIEREDLGIGFDELWAIREECILRLSE